MLLRERDLVLTMTKQLKFSCIIRIIIIIIQGIILVSIKIYAPTYKLQVRIEVHLYIGIKIHTLITNFVIVKFWGTRYGLPK